MEANDDPRQWAKLIGQVRAEVIERWTKWVIEDPSIPEANRLSRPELLDHIPKLLDEIVAELNALAHGESSAKRVRRTQRALDAAAGHGKNRVLAGYDLRATMRELGIFRAVLLERCAEAGLPLAGAAATATHRVIDTAFAQAATTMDEAFGAALAAERDRVEQINKEKDEFLSFLSHEVRNVLKAILGWSRLADGADVPTVRKAIGIVEHNATLLSRLVDDVVEFRRSGKGKLRLEMGPVHVSEALHAALETARVEAETKGVSLAVRDGDDAVIRADPARLAQVLGNLLDNAIKFTPAGGRVETWVEPHDDEVLVGMHDTGQGIAPDVIERVFDPYRQITASSDAGKEGLGLGLALVRELVERQGGEVRCESEGTGRGTTFWLSFPREAA